MRGLPWGGSEGSEWCMAFIKVRVTVLDARSSLHLLLYLRHSGRLYKWKVASPHSDVSTPLTVVCLAGSHM